MDQGNHTIITFKIGPITQATITRTEITRSSRYPSSGNSLHNLPTLTHSLSLTHSPQLQVLRDGEMKIILTCNFIIIDLDGGCISFITHTHNTHTHAHTHHHNPQMRTHAHTNRHIAHIHSSPQLQVLLLR